MDYWDYLRKEYREAEGLTESLSKRLAELMSRGHSISDLLAHYTDDFGHLPADRLRTLARAHRGWQIWRRRKAQLTEARQQANLPTLPDEVLSQASSPDQLDAVARCARLCPLSETDSQQQWTETLTAGLRLWLACVALARKHGSIRCEAKDLEAPETANFDMYLGTREPLADVAPHRWLAIRRGARQGLLALSISLPVDQLVQQVEVHRAQLRTSNVSERSSDSLLEELVLNDLQPWLLSMIDAETEWQAIQSACQSLTGLLQTAPLQARRVGAIYLGRGRSETAAVIVADREGELVAQRVLKPEGSWIKRALELFEQNRAHQIVIPGGGIAPEMLTSIERDLAEAGLQVQRVRPAALSEARRPLTDPPHRLGGTVASALVLARRALDPIKAWSAVDPVGIGVAEYQHDLDADRLRTALVETVEICRLARRRGKSSGSPGPTSRGSSAGARLNALVKSIADLRPGMSVQGVVTNISHFGAFVGLGLPQEALVHISELSDEFVSNPNEVVHIGQQVTARVLSCDINRGRISLTMRSPERVAAQVRRSERQGSSDGPGAGQRPRTKAEALANLERLFKK